METPRKRDSSGIGEWPEMELPEGRIALTATEGDPWIALRKLVWRV